MQQYFPGMMVICASLFFQASGEAQQSKKKQSYRSTDVELTDEAPNHWLLKKALVGARMVSDRNYQIISLPREVLGGTLVQRHSGDSDQWLPPGAVKVRQDGTVYALVRWKYLGKAQLNEVAFTNLERDGWTEVDGKVATSFPSGEDWRWKALKKQVIEGDTNLQLKTLSWQKCQVLFVFKAGPRTSEPALLLDLRIQSKKGVNHVLQVSLTNDGPETFQCRAADLPWNNRGGLTLVLAKINGGEILQAPTTADDPIPGTAKLKPGETLKAEIYLEKRFPKVREILLQGSADLFWGYQLKALDGKESGRMGGWTYLPKSR